jgi:hypothetical protein
VEKYSPKDVKLLYQPKRFYRHGNCSTGHFHSRFQTYEYDSRKHLLTGVCSEIRVRNKESERLKKEGCANHPSPEGNTELNKLKNYFIVPSMFKTKVIQF